MSYDLTHQRFEMFYVLKQVLNLSASGHKERMYECKIQHDFL